jgi:hypothetical protein
MELMEESDAGTGIALGRLFPINALTLKVKSTKDRLALATLRLMDFACCGLMYTDTMIRVI